MFCVVSQSERIYPHIASYDAKNGTNAAWLSCLTEGNFRFSEWRTSQLIQPVQVRSFLSSPFADDLTLPPSILSAAHEPRMQEMGCAALCLALTLWTMGSKDGDYFQLGRWALKMRREVLDLMSRHSWQGVGAGDSQCD